MSEQLLTLYDVIHSAINTEFANMHTCLPARIESYNSTKCLANVKPLIMHRAPSGEVLSMPTIYNVPVVFPRTVSAAITFPINAGDLVLVLFSERSLDTWVTTGGEVDPRDQRTHDLTDAIAIPGLFPSGQGKAQSNNTDLTIQLSSQKITIKASGDIEIGGSSLQKVVTESYKTYMDTIVTALSTFLAGLNPTTLPAQAVAFKAVLDALTIPVTSLTSKTKVQ